MKTGASPIVALCGPSCVGKGFIKRELGPSLVEIRATEPIVATTREPRAYEGESRRAGLSTEEFLAEVNAGTIVLPHRPFRDEASHLYGFVTDSFDMDRSQLTEVHSTIIEPFRELVAGRPSLVIGLVASRETLELNMALRTSSGIMEGNNDQRIQLASTEMSEIFAGYAAGLVDTVVSLEDRSRDQSIATVIHNIRGFYDGTQR